MSPALVFETGAESPRTCAGSDPWDIKKEGWLLIQHPHLERRAPGHVPAPLQKVVAAPAKSSPWILSRWRDLLLFVGTPALLILLFAAAQRRWSAQGIFIFVGAFGAMGHHLPGMIRA